MQTVEGGGGLGEVVISFPLHPHRGAGSQTSAKHKSLFDLGNSPLLSKCPSMECLHYYTADRD